MKGWPWAVPLLYDMDDCRRAAEALLEDFSPEEGEALVFMGHGTEHPANAVYPAIGDNFHLLGRTDVFVGTVEGWPQGRGCAGAGAKGRDSVGCCWLP